MYTTGNVYAYGPPNIWTEIEGVFLYAGSEAMIADVTRAPGTSEMMYNSTGADAAMVLLKSILMTVAQSL